MYSGKMVVFGQKLFYSGISSYIRAYRPPGETGIARAAAAKRAVKNDRKVNQIAEAIQLAEDKKNFNQLYF